MNKIHLMNIDKIKFIDKNGIIKYEENNIKNTLHSHGQLFILRAILQTTDVVPKDELNIRYYVGLDNRGAIQESDTLVNIQQEPESNNYSRQPVTSWDISKSSTGKYFAKSSSIVFSAVGPGGSGWGPVNNIFLSTVQQRCSGTGLVGASDNTIISNCGYLISSARLSQAIKPSSGDKVVLEMSLSIFTPTL